MKVANKITTTTRRRIADELQLGDYWYHGGHEELVFLNRLFNLKELPSDDYRYNNAYDDIHKHMVINTDWESGWVFTDTRFNLMECDDDTFLNFIAETIHPAVKREEDIVLAMQEIYNKNLALDGFEIIQASEISGKPVFQGRKTVIGHTRLAAKKAEIIKYIDTEYINSKITLMDKAIYTDTDLAIGTAKELVETVCKSILKKNKIAPDPNWNVARLLKETTNSLDLQPKNTDDPQKAEASIRQILGGIASTVQGITELRNSYGTGHGKEAGFKRLEPKYAKLIVGAVSEILIFYLAANKEQWEGRSQ